MTKEAENPNAEIRPGASFVELRHSQYLWICLVVLLPAVAWAAEEPKTPAPQPIAVREIKRRSSVDFESEVLPILKANCLACHNQTTTKADLVLETPQTIRKGGESGPAVVPGKPNESLLLQIASHQKRPLMPPKDNKVAASDLKPEELGLIKLWIEQGARGEVRAYVPVQWKPLPKAIHPVYAAALTRDGQFAACSRGNQIFVYHLLSTQLVARLTDPRLSKTTEAAHLDLVQSLDFSPDGALLASGAFREVKLWRRSIESKVVATPNSSPNSFSDLAPDGSLAAIIAGNQISIRDGRTGAEKQKISSAGNSITRVSFSPDAKLIAGLSTNGLLEVWSAKDGRLLAKTNIQDGSPIAWISGKEFATSGGETNIQIWQIDTSVNPSLSSTKTIDAPLTPVVALTANGGVLAASDTAGNVCSWNLKKGDSIQKMKHGAAVMALAVSQDGQRIASAGTDKVVRLWSSGDGKQIAQLKGDRYLMEAVQAAERSTILASNEITFRKSALQTVETQRSNQLARITKANATNALTQTLLEEKQKKFASTQEAKDAAEKIVLDLQERLAKCAATNGPGNTNVSAALAVTNSAASTNLAGITNSFSKMTNELSAKLKDAFGKLSTASNEMVAAEKEFKRSEIKRSVSVHELELATNALNKAVEASAEATRALEKSETTAKQRRSDLQAAAKRATDGECVTRALTFSLDGETLVSAGDNAIYTWSADSGAAFEVYRPTNGPIRNVSFSSARLLVAAAGGSIWQWNTRPVWRLERTIGGDKIESPFADRVNAVRFSPDGKLLATGGGQPSRSGEIKIWNVANGKLQRDLPGIHSDTVFALDFAPDGKMLASGAADKFLRVTSLESGKLLKSFEGHTHHVLGVGWKQDGRTLASAGADALVKVWNFTTGERLKNVEGFGKEVTSLAFVGVTAQLLASGGDGQLRLVRENGEYVKGYTGAADFLYCAAATPDGKTVLAGGEDGVLRVWTGDAKYVATFAP